MKTTLIAVTGLSPAIVTETIWALAQRTPAIFPDQVVFITTTTGVAKIEEQLFAPMPEWKGLSVWEALRKVLNAPAGTLIAQPIAVITINDKSSGRAKSLDDIRTPEENNAAAEFIFGQVWNVVRDNNQRLIASVAGGRKTMGALLHSSVSLIGRETDLLTHILVDSPYDSLPGFFFPGQPGGDVIDRSGKRHQTKKANPMLAAVPFVPLRNRFKELDELPGSFMGLRDRLAEVFDRDAQRSIPIKIDYEKKLFCVDGKPYRSNSLELAVFEFVLRCDMKKQSFIHPKKSPQELAAESFMKWAEKNIARFPELKIDEKRGARLITHPLSAIRRKLHGASWQPAKSRFVQAPFKLEVL